MASAVDAPVAMPDFIEKAAGRAGLPIEEFAADLFTYLSLARPWLGLESVEGMLTWARSEEGRAELAAEWKVIETVSGGIAMVTGVLLSLSALSGAAGSPGDELDKSGRDHFLAHAAAEGKTPAEVARMELTFSLVRRLAPYSAAGGPVQRIEGLPPDEIPRAFAEYIDAEKERITRSIRDHTGVPLAGAGPPPVPADPDLARLNSRRVELSRKSRREGLTPEEAEELARVTESVRAHVNAVAPLPFDELGLLEDFAARREAEIAAAPDRA